MKKRMKRTISILAAMLLAFSSAAFALGVGDAPPSSLRTPEGYNAHDFGKAAAFLEQTDASGVKNGAKLSAAYDPEEPESWNASGEHIVWTESDEGLRLQRADLPAVQGGLFGPLDLSGCTALEYLDCGGSSISSIDVSGCAALDTLVCKNNRIASLNAEGCVSLRLLNCANNQIEALSISDCGVLRFLECRWNRITELELSSCPELTVLICTDNRLKTLDLTANPLLGGLRRLRMADPGEQYVSCFIALDPEYSTSNEYFVSADCYGSCSAYGGWFTEDGRLAADHTAFDPRTLSEDSFIARFELFALPGDADGDGEVAISDALMILRAALELVPGNTGPGYDVNADGAVTIMDALLILRRCLGLFG